MQALPHYRRLEPKRFLTAYHDQFRMRADGKSWPKWRRTLKTAHHYYEALLTSGIRKNMQNLAARVDVPEDELEQFIRESPWSADGLQAYLAANVPATIRSPKAGLLLDDFGIAKQGKHSVGVQRQYSGTLGKTGNCQVAVNLVYVAPGRKRNADQRTWALGTQLYLPESWANDAKRREEARVPDEVTFQPKPDIGLDLVRRAREGGVEHAFIGGDAGYGSGGDFRAQLRMWKEPYVLGIGPDMVSVIDADVAIVAPKGQRKHATYPPGTRVELARDVFARATWKPVTWAQGSQEKLTGQFYREKVRVVEGKPELRRATDEVAWLLLEKRSNESGEDEYKAYLCWGMDEATLEQLVERAHLRWAIEHFHKEAKQLLGLDRFEGRTWDGWHHHVSMVLLAYAFLAQLRAGHDTTQPLPSLRATAMAVEWELATQALMDEHGLNRNEARRQAATVLRRVSDWFKPRK